MTDERLVRAGRKVVLALDLGLAAVGDGAGPYIDVLDASAPVLGALSTPVFVSKVLLEVRRVDDLTGVVLAVRRGEGQRVVPGPDASGLEVPPHPAVVRRVRRPRWVVVRAPEERHNHVTHNGALLRANQAGSAHDQ